MCSANKRAPATLLKRDSGRGVFLEILQNFQKQSFTEHLRKSASTSKLQ